MAASPSQHSGKTTIYLKYITYFVVALLIFIFLVLLGAPSLLSSRWGKAHLLSHLNARIPGKVSAQTIHLSWFGKQKILGLLLSDPEGKPVLALDSLTADTSLANFIFSDHSPLNTKITGLNAKIIQDKSGLTNLQKALGLFPSKSGKTVTYTSSPYSIELKGVEGHVHFASKDQPISIKFSGKTKEGPLIGAFNVEALLTDFDQEHIQKLNAKITNFPVDLLDQFLAIQDLKWFGVARVTLGKTIDIDLVHKNTTEGILVRFTVASPHLTAFVNGGLIDNKFKLLEPGKITFAISQEFLQQINSEIPITLKEPVPVDLLLNGLEFPLNNFSALAFNANLQVFQANVYDIPGFDALAFRQVNVDIEKTTADALFNLNMSGETDQNGLPAYFALKGAFDHQLKNYQAVLTADPLHMKGLPGIGDVAFHEARLDVNADSFNKRKIQLTANITPLSNESLLATPAPLKITIDSDSRLRNLAALETSGTIEMEYLTFGDPNTPAYGVLKHLKMPWRIDAKNNRINFSLDGETLMGNQQSKGSLVGEIEIKNWLKQDQIDFSSLSLSGGASLKNLPVAILQAILGKNNMIDLLGNSVDIDLIAKLDDYDKSTGSLDLVIQGDQMKAKALLQVGKGITLKQNTPATLNLTLTPNRFAALRKLLKKDPKKNDEVILQGTSNVQIDVYSFKLPSKGKKISNDGALSASVKIDAMQVKNTFTGQFMALENLEGQLKSRHLASEIEFNLSGKQKDETGVKNDLSISGTMFNAFDAAGNWNKNNMALSLRSNIKHLPAGLFCQVICLEPTKRMKLEALLGPIVDIDINVSLKNLNGPVEAYLSGQNGKIILDGFLNQGFLTLNQSFYAEVIATPQLAENVLKDINPILGGMLRADDHLRITIDPNGFHLPINLQDKSNIQVGNMVVELGNAYFNNDSQVATILNLLKVHSQDEIPVWFTPIYLSVQNGVVTLQRFDMLAMESYPLAAWGTIDFPGNMIDMMVGLSGKSLQQILTIPLPSRSYMMQFPFKGKIGHARIDKSKFAAKIAALTASVAGGPHGMLVGAVIGLASGALTEESVPPPTTNPLPWNTDADEQTAEDADAPTNPIKAVQKGASNLLKSLFR